MTGQTGIFLKYCGFFSEKTEERGDPGGRKDLEYQHSAFLPGVPEQQISSPPAAEGLLLLVLSVPVRLLRRGKEYRCPAELPGQGKTVSCGDAPPVNG